MIKDPLVYAQHILDAIARIHKHVNTVTRESFLEEDSTEAAAVVRELEIIGEAASHIPDEFRNTYSQIPWQKMKDMRNELIHGYLTVDFEEVWNVVEKDIPKLEDEIAVILRKTPQER